ncbi:MAG: hypothetical protein RI907_3405 [Pseudomonadota bacterium]|jgi:hypothetical protein
MQADARTRFLAQLQQALAQDPGFKLVLAHYQGGAPDIEALGEGLVRVMARPVQIKGQPHLSAVLRLPTRDITQNWPVDDALARIATWLSDARFRNAHLHSGHQEWQYAVSKKGKATLRCGQHGQPEGGQEEATANAAAPAAHNREKHRFIGQDRPFLHELGVTDAQGQLVPAMARKYKQINKFVEVFASALSRSRLADAPDLHVVDFGSGKGYLTFAVHDWLSAQGRQPHVTGVELRDDLVRLCQGVIDRLHLQGMGYEQGDVRHYHPARLDVMIALHACDTATDHAIHLGVRAGAEVILCSPCCHKEVRPQLLSPSPLKPILQHGIHAGQQAEMLTDGLRAMLLDAVGYDTQVFEFISLEHTNKNKMILAIKRPQATPAREVLQQVADIKAFYGVRQQCLEQLLREGGLLPAAA